MGGRLSVPRGPGGTTEASSSTASTLTRYALNTRRKPLNYRMILGPLGVLTLSALFWVYSRTSIRAAKENARRHREADGGSISWRNEALRRHGALAKPETRTLMQELFASGKDDEEVRKRDREVVMKRRRRLMLLRRGLGGLGRGSRRGQRLRRRVVDELEGEQKLSTLKHALLWANRVPNVEWLRRPSRDPQLGTRPVVNMILAYFLKLHPDTIRTS